MANIKHLQMWNSICADARVSVSKSLFGLRTIATFSPTNSVIDANTFEYPPADGERIKHLLEILHEKKVDAIGDFHPKTTVNGNYMAEVCASRDGVFLAVQLFQFTRMSYEPVTEVLIFEGDEAHVVAKLF